VVWWTAVEGDDWSCYQAALERLHETLGGAGGTVVLARIYTSPGSGGQALEAWERAAKDAGATGGNSPTLLVNRLCLETPVGGFQCIVMCASTGLSIEAVHPDAGPGIAVRERDQRTVFLPAAVGPGPLDHDSLFAKATERLGAEGFSFRDVARTWLYVRDLVDTYPELNEARDAAFVSAGMGVPGAFERPPSSTGIQGMHPQDHRAFMELVAIKRNDGSPSGRPIQPELQPQAWSYGPSFSRGMVVRLADVELVTLSGTASIAADGSTFAPGDPRAQIETTLANLGALLATVGLDLESRGIWTLYFKDEATWDVWKLGVQEGRYPNLPGPAIYADVCRDALLFEAEVTLVKPPTA